MNTIAAAPRHLPRPVLIGVIALTAAVAALMVVRVGVLGGSSGTGAVATAPERAPAKAAAASPAPEAPAAPKVVLLPGLPPGVAHALRTSRVVVVSLYFGQIAADHASVTEARLGALAAGAGFVAVNVGNDSKAASIASFAGLLSSPSMLVVRRPGKIVTQIEGHVDSAVVSQAAHNAGARR